MNRYYVVYEFNGDTFRRLVECSDETIARTIVIRDFNLTVPESGNAIEILTIERVEDSVFNKAMQIIEDSLKERDSG